MSRSDARSTATGRLHGHASTPRLESLQDAAAPAMQACQHALDRPQLALEALRVLAFVEREPNCIQHQADMPLPQPLRRNALLLDTVQDPERAVQSDRARNRRGIEQGHGEPVDRPGISLCRHGTNLHALPCGWQAHPLGGRREPSAAGATAQAERRATFRPLNGSKAHVGAGRADPDSTARGARW